MSVFKLDYYEHQIDIALNSQKLSPKLKKTKLRNLVAHAYERGVEDARMDEDYYAKPR